MNTRLFSTRALRRSIQTASLLAFLVLTFYVCCPYAGLVMENAPPPLANVAKNVATNDNDAFGAELAGDDVAASPPPPTLQKIPDHYTESFRRKSEYVAPYLFLAADPSVALIVLASQDWAAFRGEILVYAGVVIFLSWIFTRCFCGYVCPMGTCVDASDTLFARIRRFRHSRVLGGNLENNTASRREATFAQANNNALALGPRRVRGGDVLRRLRFGVLIVLIVAALCGVVLTGYVSPIPILTRNVGFVFAPFQTAYYRGWHQVPPHDLTVWISVLTFGAILAAGLFTPRFFCRFLCPSGALFSLVNAVSSSVFLTQRHKDTKGDEAGKLLRASVPSCETPPKIHERRRILQYGLACGGLGAATAFVMSRLRGDDARAATLIRPPGSLDEERFLKLCVRCGACFRVCPNDALQPCDLEHGLSSLWTPRLAADWSGCEPSCNNCGGVCPSGAIQPLTLAAKRRAVMGVAAVERGTCLPYAGREECKLCYDECKRAGYDAIEFMQVGTEVDSDGQPIEGSGFTAPVVLCDKCIGCGLCQARCYAINVKTKKLLTESAVIVKRT